MLAAQGVRVALFDLNAERGEAIAAEIGGALRRLRRHQRGLRRRGARQGPRRPWHRPDPGQLRRHRARPPHRLEEARDRRTDRPRPRHLREGRRDQPDRHLPHDREIGGGARRARARSPPMAGAASSSARPPSPPRTARSARRPMRRLQGRRRRHDPADRARSRRARHPRHDDHARPVRDPDVRAACPTRRAPRSRPPSRTPRASAGRRNMRRWCAASSRTTC